MVIVFILSTLQLCYYSENRYAECCRSERRYVQSEWLSFQKCYYTGFHYRVPYTEYKLSVPMLTIVYSEGHFGKCHS